MNMLMLQSYLLLIKIDLMMRFRSFESIHRLVRTRRATKDCRDRTIGVEIICQTIDLACVFYVKPVLCLQRSAVAAILLQRYGWQAQMIIGAKLIPFKSHAWVEVDGKVVNDNPYMHEIYSVLDRC
jgi:Transglutaminase-like superfamily